MKLLIDTDPGVDDAWAILMALADPGVEMLGLSVVAGNVGLGHCLRNACKLLEVAGREDIPVFPGAAHAIAGEIERADFVHGRDGFGDTGYLPPRKQPEQEHAASAIVRLARAHAGELCLVALGPLTNLALALALDPGLPRCVGRLVVMGGALDARGNLERAAVEFNFGADPEAARAVLRAFPRVELVDWSATLAHLLPLAELDAWLATGERRARFYRAIARRAIAFQQRLHPGLVHAADALAMCVALAPESVEAVEEIAVRVEVAGRDTRGMSVNLAKRRGEGRGGVLAVRRVREAILRQRLASAFRP
ncbi:MAG: inosine-uridine preferring nucleoside hydrolase [Lysobacterales bacterium]|jgi:purine nucleosidase|nr:MAG: inosine-uridine preferring nucleoside hydrolase [Xanthomonadales bacterium]